MRFDIRETAAERVILCAHRGIWGGNIPCNNLTAYDIAVREGADMVEIDVTKCADGELFIFHPGMEKRHLGMDVHIEQMTADEVRKLRLCNYDGAPTEITGRNWMSGAYFSITASCSFFGAHFSIICSFMSWRFTVSIISAGLSPNLSMLM